MFTVLTMADLSSNSPDFRSRRRKLQLRRRHRQRLVFIGAVVFLILVMVAVVVSQLFIRIHCDGSTNNSTSGASTLYPALIPGWTDDIYDSSYKAATAVQSALVNDLGIPDHGTVERSDMTGFNWADVPAILPEVGFMSNPDEDVRLNSADYQLKVAQALARGIEVYFAAAN